MAYVVLLRGINVGGNKKVSMADLRALAESLGFQEPQTILNSGNLVVRGRRQAAAAIEKLFRPRLDCEVFVRTVDEWETIVANNPFKKEESDPARLHVMCLHDAPDAEAIAAARAAIVGRERIEVRGREAYLFYPDGMGQSKFTNAVIEKKLGTQGTARNWNTVLKLRDVLR